jgi:hypothetical protein
LGYCGAPAEIHAEMIWICAAVRQARGLLEVVEHSSGIRLMDSVPVPFLHVLLPWMTDKRKLPAVLPGAISCVPAQCGMAVATGVVRREYNPEAVVKLTCVLPPWHFEPAQLLASSDDTAANVGAAAVVVAPALPPATPALAPPFELPPADVTAPELPARPLLDVPALAVVLGLVLPEELVASVPPALIALSPPLLVLVFVFVFVPSGVGCSGSAAAQRRVINAAPMLATSSQERAAPWVEASLI